MDKKIKLILIAEFILVISLIYLMTIYIYPLSFENKFQENTNTFSYQELYSQVYLGIRLYSDVNNFTKIESLLDELNFTKEDYTIEEIIYYQDTLVQCDGSFYGIGIIHYPCNRETSLRNYKINKDNSEKFILAHELGHSFLYGFLGESYLSFDYVSRENMADAYAFKLIRRIKNGKNKKLSE